MKTKEESQSDEHREDNKRQHHRHRHALPPALRRRRRQGDVALHRRLPSSSEYQREWEWMSVCEFFWVELWKLCVFVELLTVRQERERKEKVRLLLIFLILIIIYFLRILHIPPLFICFWVFFMWILEIFLLIFMKTFVVIDLLVINTP